MRHPTWINHDVTVQAATARFRAVLAWPPGNPRQWVLWSATSIIALGLVLILSQWVIQWDGALVKQRLMGELTISTGKHSARSITELNTLSWENGLTILETLDQINQEAAQLDTLRQQGKVSPGIYVQAADRLDQLKRQLTVLIQDQKTLQKTAAVFHDELYAPVYEQYYEETLAKVYSVQQAARPTKNPSQPS